jgi:hypothetical protein
MSEQLKKEYLALANYLEGNKGLNTNWPIAMKEAIKHLREVGK